MALIIQHNFVHPFTTNSFRAASFVAKRVPSTAAVRSKVPRCCTQTTVRRTANYQPSIWSYEDLQSLTSLYVGQSHASHAEELIANARMMLQKVVEPLEQLQLIDTLQIMGISYHFEDDIDAILKTVFMKGDYGNQKQIGRKSLYHTALEFRLLRQHGCHVPPDVFESFKDENGNFDEQLCNDTEELLCLYQATFLSVENETILEDAKVFSRKHLSEKLKKEKDQHLAGQVEHVLKLPLHRRMKRLEARWSIDMYENRKKCNPLIIELAKLDFNIVQAKYQEELKDLSRWWRQIGLAERMTFSRDRTVECFFWAVGIRFEPQFGEFRIMLARLILLIGIIDDVYDVYGTLDELEKFTNVAKKGWEINEMDQLPDYLKICFLAVYNSINDMGYEVVNKHGINVIGCLQKEWAEVFKAYYLEAKWHHTGYVPTFQEYLDNAKISIPSSLMLRVCYFFTTNPLTKEAMERLDYCGNTISNAAAPFRLSDDLATESDEKERGDAPKAIQCYTHETGASEEEARKFIDSLINQAWEKLNGEQCSDSGLPKAFKESAMNLVRSAQCVYEYGDGHGRASQDGHTLKRIVSLLIEPISITKN